MDISKLLPFFLAFLDFQDSDGKIHHSSVEKSSSSKQALIEPLLEDFTFVVVGKYEFQNLYIIIENIFGIFASHETEAKKKHRHQGLKARLATRVSQQSRKSCHRHSMETSVVHGFDINLDF